MTAALGPGHVCVCVCVKVGHDRSLGAGTCVCVCVCVCLVERGDHELGSWLRGPGTGAGLWCSVGTKGT